MFTFVLITILSNPSQACINGMFGAKKITFKGFNKDKRVHSKVKFILPFVYECMIEHSPNDLTYSKEMVHIDIQLKDNSIQKMSLKSTERTEFTKEHSCLKKVFQRYRFPPSTEESNINGYIEFTHDHSDKEAFQNMLPKNLNGSYRAKNERLKITREDLYINYQYSYHSTKDKCQFEYSGRAKIYPIARVMDESECMHSFSIEKNEIIFNVDKSCDAVPECFPVKLEDSVLKKTHKVR